MNDAQPYFEFSPEVGIGAALPLLLFGVLGLALLVFPRRVVELQIRFTEHHLRKLKNRPPLLFMRLLGAAFAAIGLFSFIGLVRAAG